MGDKTSAAAAISHMPPGYLHEYTGTKIVILAIAFMPIQIAFVSLRWYSRRLCKTYLSVDDVLSFPALFFCLAVDILAIAMVKYGGVGRHTGSLQILEPKTILIWAKLLITIGWTYAIAVVLGKLCILGIYLRLFQTRLYRAITWALCASILLISLVGGITGTVACQPIAFLWNPTIPGGHCIDVQQFLKWMTFPNILTDIVILVLPVKIAWSLDLPKPQKVALTITFSAGLVGAIAAMLRFLSFFREDVNGDGTFWSVEFLTWTIIEPGFYLVSACLLLFRPLIQHVVLCPLKKFTGKYIRWESGYDGHELRSFQCIGRPEDLAALSTCDRSEGKEGSTGDLEHGKEPIAHNGAVGTLFEKVLTVTGQEVHRAAQNDHSATSASRAAP